MTLTIKGQNKLTLKKLNKKNLRMNFEKNLSKLNINLKNETN